MNRSVAALIVLVAATGHARGVLNEDALAKKREGSFITALPLLNYSSDTGFGYGARVYLHQDGRCDDQCFAITPYRGEWYANVMQTTSGWQYDVLSADLPALANGDWRLRAQAIYEKDTNRNFYGLGAESMRGLPGSTFAANQERLDRATPAGPGSTDGWHNKYRLERPDAFVQLERQLGGAWSAMAGVEAIHTGIGLYDGRPVAVSSGTRVMPTTSTSLKKIEVVATASHRVRRSRIQRIASNQKRWPKWIEMFMSSPLNPTVALRIVDWFHASRNPPPAAAFQSTTAKLPARSKTRPESANATGVSRNRWPHLTVSTRSYRSSRLASATAGPANRFSLNPRSVQLPPSASVCPSRNPNVAAS